MELIEIVDANVCIFEINTNAVFLNLKDKIKK